MQTDQTFAPVPARQKVDIGDIIITDGMRVKDLQTPEAVESALNILRVDIAKMKAKEDSLNVAREEDSSYPIDPDWFRRFQSTLRLKNVARNHLELTLSKMRKGEKDELRRIDLNKSERKTMRFWKVHLHELRQIVGDDVFFAARDKARNHLEADPDYYMEVSVQKPSVEDAI